MTVRARLDSFVMLSCMNTDSWPAAEGTSSAAVPEQHTHAAVSVSLRDDPNAGRYGVRADGELVGFAQYRLRDGRIVFFHTEIAPAHEHGGLGSELARFALEDARRRGLAVVPPGPFVAGFSRRHPDEYLPLVLPGVRARVMRDAGRD